MIYGFILVLMNIAAVVSLGLIALFFKHVGLQFGFGVLSGMMIAFTWYRLRHGHWPA